MHTANEYQQADKLQVIGLGLAGVLRIHYTPCLKKNCQCYFVNNSVKRWPNLIIFGMQHRKET